MDKVIIYIYVCVRLSKQRKNVKQFVFFFYYLQNAIWSGGGHLQ